MSFAYKKYKDLDLTIFTLEDLVELDDWLNSIDEYNRSGATKLELYDLRKVSGEFKTAYARQLHYNSSPKSSSRDEKARTAILVTTPSAYGLARVYTAYAEADGVPWKVEIFYSMEEACQWLGVDMKGVIPVP
ncbi:MAG: hypothetical protein CVV44_22385 [Spirochaetae bacterium HGW-Spirochaetae-1]|jgi:hypothetical protein|nr:MAG: hypothetical protein CVV44_22385 [Spirochaetae bacterium HGW-Spirochaetae-1]